MDDLRQAAQRLLYEADQALTSGVWSSAATRSIADALRAALAEPAEAGEQQQPVAWMREGWGPDCGPYTELYRDDEMGRRDRVDWTALYAAPVPQRRPMTPRASESDVAVNADRLCTSKVDHPSTFTLGWRAAEAFHGIAETK